jgi:hypothetical protein
MKMRNPFESRSWTSPLSGPSWSRLPATAGVVVSTALLAGLGYAVWRTLRRSHALREGAQPARQPEDLTRWEGEGGGVGSSTATGPGSLTPAGTLGASSSGLPH